MALYPGPSDGGLQSADLAAAMMASDPNLMSDLDMGMGLSMDLDLDLGGDPGQTFNPVAAVTHDGSTQRSDSSLTPSGGTDGGAMHAQQPQDVNMSGAGAGPLPTGFGLNVPISTSTLTEFTKRRNWSQRIIEELKDFLHILTPDGRILYVSPSCTHITGYEPRSLIGKFIGEYVHPDDSGIFMREFNESIASGNALRFFYRFKKDDGTYTIFECHGHPHLSPEPVGHGGQLANGQQAVPGAGMCRGFFMMARPYPTKNAALLDSFLEHKIENERLLKKIEELKREEMEETGEQDRPPRGASAPGSGAGGPASSDGQVAAARSLGGDAIPTPEAAAAKYQGMPPPAKPPISNVALTRQNLDSALSSQKPDSIMDKMSRYEANSTHLESIELLTGLRYRDGERSHGISTGDASPALIRGDAGIAILLDRDREGAKKEKKKLKVADEYVCADCGTLDSPEWRKGPKGPKTLCNACGLRWAKKEKKDRPSRGDDAQSSHSPGGGSTPMAPPSGAMTGLTAHSSDTGGPA